MMVGRVFLVLTGACQFGHGVGGFTTNFIHSGSIPGVPEAWQRLGMCWLIDGVC